MEIITDSAQATQKLGEQIAAYLIEQGKGERARILSLHGELGSGKTTFVQGLARGLGLPHRVVSPTFIISRMYELQSLKFSHLHHVDVYRLEGQTAASFGLPEILANPNNIVVIEWAELLSDPLPESRTDIYFRQLENGDHEIKIKGELENYAGH